jgi:hypothetical protein
MYQVIARKYWPQTFADVVNQEHVKTTLEMPYPAASPTDTSFRPARHREDDRGAILARCRTVQGPTVTPDGVRELSEIAQGNAPDDRDRRGVQPRINDARTGKTRYRPVRDR